MFRNTLFRAAIAICVLLTLCFAGADVVVTHPDLAARAADWARNIVGPAPVAAAESAFYRAADVYERLRYQVTGSSQVWHLATPVPSVAGTVADATPAAPGSTAPAGDAAPAGARPESAGQVSAATTLQPQPAMPSVRTALTPTAGDNQASSSGATPASDPLAGPERLCADLPGPAVDTSQVLTPTEPLAPLEPLLTKLPLPGEGAWQPLVIAAQTGDNPILWQTVYRPDPARPYAHVALVAMDLTRVHLGLVIGTREPVSKVPANGLRTGAIPSAVQAGGKLLAAWNGGFRAVHGHYGIMTDGTTWLPPIEGMQTAAITHGGGLRMGAWGRGIDPSGSWQAWRQNNPPLIENGQINPDVTKYASTIRWGASLDGAVFIWRSGMGLSPGGRWLIYVAGNALSVATLTDAFAAAGVSQAMQLDVNASYERFVTFSPDPQTAHAGGKTISLPVTAHRLLDQMVAGPTQFLIPDDRDFFYLEANQGPTTTQR